jgi:hypothetical protein
LLHILDGAPLLAKKSGEVAIWGAAIRAWLGTSANRWTRMAELARELADHRRFHSRPNYTSVDISQSYLEWFFSGFATGEAHFGATVAGWPRFVITLRADDRPILVLLRERIGDVGRLVERAAHRSSKPATSWLVTRLAELRRIIDVLDRHPVAGRQGRVYARWRELVMIRLEHRGGAAAAARAAAVSIRHARTYRPSRAVRRRDLAQVRQDEARDILTRWATAPDSGPLTCTSYERHRRSLHPEWPTRNTIVRRFGSWRSALEACGLSTAHARNEATVERARRSSAPHFEAHRARMRIEVLVAVRRCERDLKRPPTATEFLRWRRGRAPGTPSHATIYRLFPGGWAEVLDAAEREE